MRATETVLKFLGSIGRRSEAEMYWRLFRERPPESFALIAAEAAVLNDALGSVIEQFQYLSELGLTPGLILGLFRPEQSEALSGRVLGALTHAGLEARCHDVGDEGLTDAVAEDMRTGKLPVIRFLPGSEQASGRGRDFAARMSEVGSWARVLGTGKLVILRERGGLGPRARGRLELSPGHVLNSHAGGLSLINLRTDFDALLARGLLSRPELDLLDQIRDLELEHANDSSKPGRSVAVSIASPLNLLQELFTVRGAGTLIVPGTPIARVSSYADLDRNRLTELFRASFDKTLRADFYDRDPAAIYLEPEYRGAVVLEQSPIAPYLTKFAVDRVAQGEGIGRDLWYAVCRDQAAFYWRARDSNRISSWYTTMCDGMVRADGWFVYWRGVQREEIPAVVEQALKWPDDFDAPQDG